VVETIGARKRTPSRGHEADPTALGIDDPLKIKDIIVFQGQGLKVRQSSHGVDLNLAIPDEAKISYLPKVIAPLQLFYKFQKGLFRFSPKNKIKQPRL